MTEVLIKYNSGRQEYIECTAIDAISNSNVLKVTVEPEEVDGHHLGKYIYIPLYNVEKYIPCGTTNENRYIN